MADVIFHDAATEPGTHALVIGIGQYPHLLGGDAPGQATDGLRQLSSPPISARDMADWLLREYRCPGKELASLALLTSEPNSQPFVDPRTGTPHAVPTADIGTIVAAVREWRQRGDTSPDNRLIFYFCGHGTSRGVDMALLARDFNLDDDNPLEQALDLWQLVNGLQARCKASQQIFFVDACRAGSDLLINQRDDGGVFAGQVPLLGGRRPLELPRCAAMTYYSTGAGDLSHARPNSVSLFTGAVLRALRGAGGDDPENGVWRVSTSDLHAAVVHFMNDPVFAGAVVGVQVPAVNAMPMFDVHELRGLPVVPVYVSCVPPDGNQIAEFVCRQNGAEISRRPSGAPDPNDPTGQWLLDLAFGTYEFEATVARDDVRVQSREIRPIFRIIKLEKPV